MPGSIASTFGGCSWIERPDFWRLRGVDYGIAYASGRRTFYFQRADRWFFQGIFGILL